MTRREHWLKTQSQKQKDSKPMTQTTHTPGPWALSEYRPTYDDVGGDYSVGYTDADGVYWDIATLEPSRANRKADAHLIAAAPEILEALEWAVETADAEQYEADWYAAARVAIAKARGE
jgi:hypothetical protein